MADITARLIWYKLGEVYKNTATKCERFLEWYEEFSWRRVDILDMLFLGWLVGAFVVVGALNLYLRFFGLPRYRKKDVTDGRPSVNVDQRVVTPQSTKAESVQWLNAAFTWFYRHYQHTPDCVDAWLRALNEEAKKHAVGDHQVRFDRVQTGTPPPHLTKVSTDLTATDVLTVYAQVDVKDASIELSSVHQSATSVRVTNCDAVIASLKGRVRIQSVHSQDELQMVVSFASDPELSLSIKPRNYDTTIDQAGLEVMVRAALCGAVTHVSLSSKGGFPSFFATPSVKANGTATQLQQPAQVPRSLHGRKLLVKIIKANGLGDKDFACADPYCIVLLDEPSQKHTTSVVRNTVNPFWDEHFQFFLEEGSRHVSFEVYDREKPAGDDLLGRASVAMEELRRMPSSRQIVPLTGRHGSTSTSGSITVEFLFLEPSDTSLGLVGTELPESLSPKRRIETSRHITPGGTVVTTQTTTTEKPRDLRHDPYKQDSPSLVEKLEYISSPDVYTTYNKPVSSLEAHDAALTASQAACLANGTESIMETALRGLQRGERDEGSEGEKRHPPNRTSTLVITSVHREPSVPLIKTTDSSAAGDGRPNVHDRLSMISQGSLTLSGSCTPASLSPEPRRSREVKKTKSFASTLKKRFARPKKTRSQSADRVQSSSFREGALLKPPDRDPTRSADDSTPVNMPEGRLRKSRSQSFSSSLKRIFKKKKSKEPGVSRESSLSRASGHEVLRDEAHTPDVTYASRDLTLRHPTPNPEFPDTRHQYGAPNSTPLYRQ